MRDTIEMAREAGFNFTGIRDIWCDSTVVLKAFEALVRADEREACAKVCEALNKYMDDGEECAAAIRNRGNT
jgi:hypothetical protein